MPANPRSSSTSAISSAEKPTISSANVHSSSSTSGTPTDVSRKNAEDQKATNSLCCIPVDTATVTTPGAPPESKSISRDHALLLVNRIEKNIAEEKKAYDYLNEYRVRKQNEEASRKLEEKIEERLDNKIGEASKAVKSLAYLLTPRDDKPGEGPIETDDQEEIIELEKDVNNIRLQIISELKPLFSTSKAHPHRKHRNNYSTRERRKSRKLEKKVPNLCKNETLSRSYEFKDFKELYDGLGNKQKLCLLCFSVFPEKEIIKKRFMFYWWIGEGFVTPAKDSEHTIEESANVVFSELMAKGFIEPFPETPNLAGWVSKCQIHPFVRAAVITLARRAKFFDFDEGGKPTGKFLSSYRACLFAGETLTEGEGMDNVHMVFNVDETIIDFQTPEVFSKMKNINLLCLGRWRTSQTHHIEFEDTKILEGLKNMKYLKFLSLQGISLIKRLPTSISNLTNLTILDIRACPNLEKLPREIGLLKSLTHLDMSECYLLVNMPNEISKLVELEVLKGFVVGNSEGKHEKDSCTLGHLVGLTKLRKLSIFTAWKSFPSDSEVRDLNQLKKLLILSIEWGKDTQGKSKNKTLVVNTENPENGATIRESHNVDDEAESSVTPFTRSTTKRCICLEPAMPTNCFRLSSTTKMDTDASPTLPTQPEKLKLQLEKLDLQCFPHLDAPTWLMESELEKLKKLYIRGGLLRDLGQFGFQKKKEWTVEILRLKFLHNLEIDWRDFLRLFPRLIFLEKVRCPKLTFFPCDEQGIWIKKSAKSN